MMNLRRSHRRRGALVASVLLLIVFGLVIAAINQDAIEELFVDPAPAETPLPAAPATTAEERAMYDYVSPRLAALTAEAELLEQMGRERSRNLVELQVRSDRVSQLADEIDSFLAYTPVPSRFQPAIDRYVAAVAETRAGMQESRAAVFRFDWDAVAAGLDHFSRGTDELKAVSAMFQELVGGDATPAAASLEHGQLAA
jgi:hypothetical protein